MGNSACHLHAHFEGGIFPWIILHGFLIRKELVILDIIEENDTVCITSYGRLEEVLPGSGTDEFMRGSLWVGVRERSRLQGGGN